MKKKKIKAYKISEELQGKLESLRVCKACPVIKQDLAVWRKKRCVLCGSLTSKYVLPTLSKITTNGAKNKPKENGSFQVDRNQMAIISMITGRTKDFDCPGVVSNIVRGPVVTEYEFTPDRFTRIRKLRTLDEDLALALSVDTVSIRRIPGRPCIGISIPNPDRAEVTFENCLKNTIVQSDDMAVPLNFGIMSDGSPYVEDLAKYPHLLIGGATGTGKSVLLHQLISNLMLVRSPKQLQFVFIDPKTVELFPYKGIPHLKMEPVSTVWRAIDVLSEMIKIMKDRTEVLHMHEVSNISDFNRKITGRADTLYAEGREDLAQEELQRRWPYIVIVIDEFADIVIQEKKAFINRMASISQMARASGISVIAATQRPSVDVLPGKVKVNFLARAAFRMPSTRDSQTVLNYRGAETLLGKGDMFMLSPDKTGLQRIHVANCRREDRDGIVRRAMGLGYSEQGILLGG